MSEQLRIILIIIISVSIFGLIVFVMVKNYIRNKIQYYLEEKNKKTKEDCPLVLMVQFFSFYRFL